MQMQMQTISMSQMVIVLGKFTLSGISNVSRYKYGQCTIEQHMRKNRNAEVRLTHVYVILGYTTVPKGSSVFGV